jgi:hypothetical protein
VKDLKNTNVNKTIFQTLEELLAQSCLTGSATQLPGFCAANCYMVCSRLFCLILAFSTIPGLLSGRIIPDREQTNILNISTHLGRVNLGRRWTI